MYGIVFCVLVPFLRFLAFYCLQFYSGGVSADVNQNHVVVRYGAYVLDEPGKIENSLEFHSSDRREYYLI